MKRWSLNNYTSDAELLTSTKNGLLMFVLQCVLWLLGLTECEMINCSHLVYPLFRGNQNTSTQIL